ncbi:MAG: hydantoinase B/oxoprolinase family protein, partial [Variovorax sp.]
RSSMDGLDTLSFPSNCRVTPIEMYELAVPILIERKELIPDSGGPGKYRGGLGQRGEMRNLSDREMNIYLSTEHVKHPCHGVLGGQAGRNGAVLHDGKAIFPKGRLVLAPGERLLIELPGGGGWGEAQDRPRELVEDDLRQGLISAEGARADYGYVSAPAAAAGVTDEVVA